MVMAMPPTVVPTVTDVAEGDRHAIGEFGGVGHGRGDDVLL
ncbi:hypothetical protein [Bifidobacterium primatium]